LEETADANLDNNHWPSRPVKSRFQLFKYKDNNPMREVKEAAEAKAEPEEEKKEAESKKPE
jgi:hypothetical protein